ncbi:hypothetical protein ABZ897_39475 [Nonomuraea sp. NPDC046802]|uniref:hypothetical protein n=1 Tax=Nonomuraea sp. NPDC046802 TaxID=3154919 RepID=UPI0033E7D136
MPITAMAQADWAFCLALLAQVLCERTRLDDFARVEPGPALGSADDRLPAQPEGRS